MLTVAEFPRASHGHQPRRSADATQGFATLIRTSRNQVGGSEQMRQSRARQGAGPLTNACSSDRRLGFSATFGDNLTP